MNKEQYKEMVNKVTPKPDKFKNAFIAFMIGGLLGALTEVINKLLQTTFNIAKDEAIVWTIIIFIIIACICTAFNFFDNWVSFAKAGLIIPITGFAHSITSAAMDYKKDGMITGLGSNFFKLAGSVLVFGIISSFILVLIKVVFI